MAINDHRSGSTQYNPWKSKHGTSSDPGLGIIRREGDGGIWEKFKSDDDAKRRALLNETGHASNEFAEWNQGGSQAMQKEALAQRAQLQRYASGQDSLSAEQLRQSLGQNLAQQSSMAAGASGNNAAMAARTAAMQQGRLSSGLAGQQATAGIQERAAANKALSDMIMGQQGLHMQGALGARSTAAQSFGAGDDEKSFLEKYGPTIGAAAMAASDERLKTDIKDGDKTAKDALSKLGTYSYRYKDEKHGKGQQFGVMAQQLEKAGLGHAIVDTSEGKMVHGAKAALSGLALTAALARRVESLEKKK
jgi:hypothetical protein